MLGVPQTIKKPLLCLFSLLSFLQNIENGEIYIGVIKWKTALYIIVSTFPIQNDDNKFLSNSAVTLGGRWDCYILTECEENLVLYRVRLDNACHGLNDIWD